MLLSSLLLLLCTIWLSSLPPTHTPTLESPTRARLVAGRRHSQPLGLATRRTTVTRAEQGHVSIICRPVVRRNLLRRLTATHGARKLKGKNNHSVDKCIANAVRHWVVTVFVRLQRGNELEPKRQNADWHPMTYMYVSYDTPVETIAFCANSRMRLSGDPCFGLGFRRTTPRKRCCATYRVRLLTFFFLDSPAQTRPATDVPDNTKKRAFVPVRKTPTAIVADIFPTETSRSIHAITASTRGDDE